MKAYIKERTLQLAEHISQTEDTIRRTAQIFNLSKSTVHNDLSKRLRKVDEKKYEEVKKILDKNFEEKHIRGGQSTKKKYLQNRECER
ncbi:MAG: sporulation transcriptional regulator SpoIIID [Clostridia bacterium]|nr:sporulation transcriptional regulator SpoIIID [Clostridia bacterium]